MFKPILRTILTGIVLAGVGQLGQAHPVAPEAYLQHKAVFKDSIERVGKTPVWSLTDHGVNVIVIEGEKGLVLFDTGLHKAYVEKTRAKLRQISDKPIVAIIYSHHHVDHINGAGFWVDPAAVQRGEIPVVAASNLMAEMSDENVMLAPIMALRSSYMFGFGLEGEEKQANYVGCCGDLPEDTNEAHITSFIPPTVLVEDQQTMTLAGIEFLFFRTGGEAASHMAAYLPRYGVLLSGDEVQGPTFPNLHSMRGTKMRDANAWVKALDKMRALHAQYMVPTHGNPVSGRDKVQQILTKYRDAIQYAHDQSIRYINKGYTQEELGRKLNALPEYLHQEPWTGEHYGNVPTGAREYFTGYISWFSGDAVDLVPTPRQEYGQRVVTLMGGPEAVRKAARSALDQGDPQFAAELASLLIDRDRNDGEAREIKAKAFRIQGHQQVNTNWRNFYLMGAMELEGRLQLDTLGQQLNNPANLARLPASVLVDSLRYRVAAERAGQEHLVLAVELTDVGNAAYTVELRNSVIEVRPGDTGSAAVQLRLKRGDLARLMIGQAEVAALQKAGDLKLSGDRRVAQRFFGLLDHKVVPRGLVVH